MNHSIVFGDGTLYPAGDRKEGQFKGIDTYKDWFLIPATRPTIAMPGIESKFVSIPGRDGTIDLSDYLRERPAYGDRGGSFTFNVENDNEFWMTIYPKIVNTLHGKRFKMVLEEDDPDYYWEGRFTVSEWRSDSYWSTVTINYQIGPWKRRIRKVLDGMIWDTFNFEQDYDYDPWDLGHITVNGETWSKDIWCDGYPFVPEIKTLSGSPSVTFQGENGHAKYGFNRLTVSGTGTVSVNWRGGSL